MEIIFFFLIPESILGILVVAALAGWLFFSEVMGSLCTVCYENYWVIIVLTLLLTVIVVAVFGKKYGFLAAAGLTFASSQLLALFLDTLYDIFILGLDFMGNGMLALFIVVPIFVVYVFFNFVGIIVGIGEKIGDDGKEGSSSVLWAVGAIGWFLNIFVWS